MTVLLDDVEIRIEPDDVRITEEARGELTVKAGAGSVVGLDTRLTAELLTEGLAREIVSRVQRMRREAGLAVSDRIRLAVEGSERLEDAVRSHRERIGGETLALEVLVGSEVVGRLEHVRELEMEGETLRLALSRAGTSMDGA